MPSGRARVPTLPELQADFIDAVLDGHHERAQRWILDDGITAEARLAVYANNSLGNFLGSLRSSFPVIRRLVGDAYFDQCAQSYREHHPSTSGDLAEAGGAFAAFLAERHRGGRYRYLGEVARLEWLYQEALSAADHAPLDLGRLAAVAPVDYERLRFHLHPAARLLRSEYPLLEIWQANRDLDREPDMIDLGKGGERLLLTRTQRQLVVHRLEAGEYAFLQAVERREPLADATAAAVTAAAAFDAGAALHKFVRNETIIDFSVE